MTITRPIVVRLFEPISLLFPENAMPSPRPTVPPPNCILCEGPASPPARMGWLETPERQVVFVVCGSCSNCDDAELERRITAKLSDSRPETDDAPATAVANLPPAPAPTVLQVSRPAIPPPSVEAVPKADIYPQPAAAAHAARATEAWVKAAAKAWATPAA
jgi:hypothetical protein